MKELSTQDRAKAITTLARADLGTVLAVRLGGGGEITEQRRNELLAKLAAHEYVELEIDLLAFEQKSGERNRNFIRFRDESLRALGTSGKGTPFLRDHEQRDLGARGGTITRSKTESPVAGHYELRQTARVTAPWAVDALLRGNLDRFSIGWHPTGDVVCSVHDQPVFTCIKGKCCYCFPGDRLKKVVGEDGVERLRYASDGDLVAEWIYTKAELVETSAVSVPAVPSAQIEGIRASVAALRAADDDSAATVVVLSHSYLAQDDEERRRTAERLINSGRKPQENDSMKTFKEALAAKLGLGATASEDEVTTAVETLQAKLEIAEGARDKLATEVEGYRATERKSKQDKFIELARKERRISEEETAVWRKLHTINPKEAEAEMAKLAVNRVPPDAGAEIVEEEKQRDVAQPKELASGRKVVITERQRKLNAQMGMTDEQFIANLQKGAN